MQGTSRTLRSTGLVALLVVAATVVLVTPSPAQEADTVRIFHITLDGLHPDQISANTPNLLALKESSTWYEQHRAVMSSETLPNHVAMATGTYAERNGIPNNIGRAEPGDTDEADPDLRSPSLRTADSFVTAIERVCPDLRTVTVFSKAYVHSTFAEDGADSDFPQPTFNIPESDHAFDVFTAGYILEELTTQDPPDYLFANLGDIDRGGHIDPAGWTGVPSTQLLAIEDADTLIGQIVDTMQQIGIWEETVLVINSDHSMSWVQPLAGPDVWLDIGGRLEADPTTAGKFFVTAEGGTAAIYLLDPDSPSADEDMMAAMQVLEGVEGVREVLYREPHPLDPGKDLEAVHPDWHAGTHRIGELYLVVEAGFRSGSQFTPEWGAAPGYHGHGETRHATMMITGGWDGIVTQSIAPSDPDAVFPYDDTAALPEQSEQVDIAPTFGWLTGVPDPGISRGDDAQWQGRVLAEAFSRQPEPICEFAGTGDGGGVEPVPEPEGGGEETPSTGGGAAVLALLVVALGVRARRR